MLKKGFKKMTQSLTEAFDKLRNSVASNPTINQEGSSNNITDTILEPFQDPYANSRFALKKFPDIEIKHNYTKLTAQGYEACFWNPQNNSEFFLTEEQIPKSLTFLGYKEINVKEEKINLQSIVSDDPNIFRQLELQKEENENQPDSHNKINTEKQKISTTKKTEIKSEFSFLTKIKKAEVVFETSLNIPDIEIFKMFISNMEVELPKNEDVLEEYLKILDFEYLFEEFKKQMILSISSKFNIDSNQNETQ